MKLILISGSGIGAGKTTLSKRLTENTYSLADAIRRKLATEYPNVNFFDKSQEAKSQIVPGTGLTMRDLLKTEGQLRREKDALYWVRELTETIVIDSNFIENAAIDDIRYLDEIEAFREIFNDTVHIHISFYKSIHEPEFDNEQLARIADYIVVRNDSESTLESIQPE